MNGREGSAAAGSTTIRRALLVISGVLTGYLVFELSGSSPVLWPFALALIAGLLYGATQKTPARLYFATSFATSALAFGYVLMLWIVLGGFG